MKKLTFKQKLYNFWNNEKFKKVRDITLFISLGINLLIFILFGVVSCSVKEGATSNDHTNQPQNQLVHTRKNAIYLENQYEDGDIFKITFPSQLYLAPSQMGYFSCNYGLKVRDNLRDSEYNETQYKGFVIYTEETTTNNTTYLRLNFYDGNSARQYRFSLMKNGDWYYKDADNDYILYFCYYKDSPNNVAFFNWLNNNEELTKMQSLFSFDDYWKISDYVNSENGLSNGKYVIGQTSNNYLINASDFYINGVRYDFLAFEFDDVDTYHRVGWSVADDYDFQAYYDGNSLVSTFNGNSNFPTEYKFIFKSLIAGRSGDATSLKLLASTKHQNAKGQLLQNNGSNSSTYSYDINAEVADTMQFTNNSYKNLRFTGSSYVDYIESPVFPYEVEDNYVKFSTNPNYNAVDYLNYSYSINSPSLVEPDTYDSINLMQTAFTGLTGLFGITILPGITFGLLLFLPLVVSIIVLVFKMVKK